MLFLSDRFVWIPLYMLILFFIFYKNRKYGFLIVMFLVAAIVSSDLVASSLLKPYFQRLRPCHDTGINSFLYIINEACGGRYGFVSSHAANTFALATFLFMLYGGIYKWIEVFFIWAFFVSLSRVYLAVHYPGDVFFGAILGIVIALIFYYSYELITKKKTTYYS